LADLVKVFSGKAANRGNLKVLITMTGRSRALVKVIDPNNLLLADQDGS
jgi:hypothetical protein